MAVGQRNAGLKDRLLGMLRNPVQLRVAITALVLAVAYAGIYMPLSGEIEETTRKLSFERKRLELARDVERLEAQYKRFKRRLPEKSDTNEWVQFVLGGLRPLPLKLIALEKDPMRDVGPFKAVVLRIELEGLFPDMNRFLGWLETNERLFRVDSVRIQQHRSGNGLQVMQVTVLGLKG
jgi:hypothetical protein